MIRLHPASSKPSDLRTDAQLLAAVRAGDQAAYGELYRRHRRGACTAAARAGASGHDIDDVVADAFARVLRAVKNGVGPTDTFSGYLMTAVRRVAWNDAELRRRVLPTDDEQALDITYSDEIVHPLTESPVGRALLELPSDWRELIWRLDVLGERASDIAAERGCSANAVSAAGTRARRRIRAAVLAMAAPEFAEFAASSA